MLPKVDTKKQSSPPFVPFQIEGLRASDWPPVRPAVSSGTIRFERIVRDGKIKGLFRDESGHACEVRESLDLTPSGLVVGRVRGVDWPKGMIRPGVVTREMARCLAPDFDEHAAVEAYMQGGDCTIIQARAMVFENLHRNAARIVERSCARTQMLIGHEDVDIFLPALLKYRDEGIGPKKPLCFFDQHKTPCFFSLDGEGTLRFGPLVPQRIHGGRKLTMYREVIDRSFRLTSRNTPLRHPDVKAWFEPTVAALETGVVPKNSIDNRLILNRRFAGALATLLETFKKTGQLIERNESSVIERLIKDHDEVFFVPVGDELD
jgi:hypothetical protein